jgi:serine/threonine protein kinase
MDLVQLAADKPISKQVLVLLMVLPGDHIDQSVVEAVKTAFQNLGASDVFLVKSASEAKACVVGFLMREDESKNASGEDNVSRFPTESQYPRHGGLEQNAETMTWNNIHKSLRGFPPLDVDLDAQLHRGARIYDGVLEQRLGGGACSEVFLWRKSDGSTQAFKFVKKGNAVQAEKILSICREVKLLSRLKHPGVVSLCRVLHAREHIIIGTNFAGKINLFRFLQCATLLKKHSPESRSSLYAPINEALAYCHKQGVAHRDMKPENIGVSPPDENKVDMTLTILDFGSACRIGDYRCDLVGTMPFIAPEVVTGTPCCPARADMWSCGVIFLEIIYGVGKLFRLLKIDQKVGPSPWFGRHAVKFFTALHERYEREPGSSVSMGKDVREVLLGLLTPDPEQRWTAHDVQESKWCASTPAWTDMQDEGTAALPKVESFDCDGLK